MYGGVRTELTFKRAVVQRCVSVTQLVGDGPLVFTSELGVGVVQNVPDQHERLRDGY